VVESKKNKFFGILKVLKYFLKVNPKTLRIYGILSFLKKVEKVYRDLWKFCENLCRKS